MKPLGGHIAVAAGSRRHGVDVIEQDDLHNPADYIAVHSVLAGGAVIGWLRPRPEKIIGYTPGTNIWVRLQ